MKEDRFLNQINFLLEIDKEKDILRQTHTTSGKRENDAEHAWHMAIMIYLLKEYSNNKIDVAKTIIMTLIHDVVEIDAGDTYAYDEEGAKTQKEREEKAANRIFSLLPQDQKEEMLSLFKEFEKGESPEAQFAKCLDNFQPIILNDYNNGQDWKLHKVTKSQITERNKRTKKGSKTLYEHIAKIIENNVKKGNIIDK